MGNRRKDEEALLVRECLQGSQHAWQEFYSRYVGLVRCVVRRHLIASAEDVEDVTQNVFASLISSLKTYDPGFSSLPRFICMISERACIQEYRARTAAKREGETEVLDLHDISDKTVTKVAHDSESPEEQLETRQMIHILKLGLRSLNDKCRELLKMRFYEEMAYKEIARTIGGTENTLTVQARRCLDTLKDVCNRSLGKKKKSGTNR